MITAGPGTIVVAPAVAESTEVVIGDLKAIIHITATITTRLMVGVAVATTIIDLTGQLTTDPG